MEYPNEYKTVRNARLVGYYIKLILKEEPTFDNISLIMNDPDIDGIAESITKLLSDKGAIQMEKEVQEVLATMKANYENPDYDPDYDD